MPPRAIFVSDVHLTPAEPDTFVSFCRFLDAEARGAERLYVLGDLFDVWVGPRQASVPCFPEVFRRLRGLRDAGVDIAFVRGNRDFALEGKFAEEVGLTVLPDVATVDVFGRGVVLTHGDLLCTRDRAYHRMRRFVRSAFARGLLRMLPLSLALRIARGFRWASVAEVARKSEYEMTIDFDEVRRLLGSGADAIVCGHLHSGERYRLEAAGREAEVVILPGWDGVPGYAVCDGGPIELRAWPPGSASG